MPASQKADQPAGVVDVDHPGWIDDDMAKQVGFVPQRFLAACRDLPDLHQVRDLMLGTGVVNPGRRFVRVFHPFSHQDLGVADLRLVIEPHHRFVEPVNVFQRFGQQCPLDGVLARDLAPLASTEVMNIAAGDGAEMNLAGADGTIEARIPAPM